VGAACRRRFLASEIDLPTLAHLSSNPYQHYLLQFEAEADDVDSCSDDIVCIFVAGLWSTGISIVSDDEPADPVAITNDMRWWRSRLARGAQWWRDEVSAGRWPPDNEAIDL
jgi:hypothetical protein